MAKNIYEYIGKKELFRRAQNVSYIELPKIKNWFIQNMKAASGLKTKDNNKVTSLWNMDTYTES